MERKGGQYWWVAWCTIKELKGFGETCTDVSLQHSTVCENHDLLNPLVSQHIYALQYVYIPRINRALSHFQEAWNNHGLRTERGQTPNQLFTAGALRLHTAGLVSLDFFDAVPDAYGVDEEGVGSPGSDEDGVVVPPLDFELTGEQLRELQAAVHPLSDSEEFGIDLYIRTLEFLEAIAN